MPKRLQPGFPRRAEHPAAAFVADVGPIIQHAGDSGNADAADAGDIFDGHGSSSCRACPDENGLTSLPETFSFWDDFILAIFTGCVNAVS